MRNVEIETRTTVKVDDVLVILQNNIDYTDINGSAILPKHYLTLCTWVHEYFVNTIAENKRLSHEQYLQRKKAYLEHELKKTDMEIKGLKVFNVTVGDVNINEG